MTPEKQQAAICEALGWKRMGNGQLWISPKSGYSYLECELKTIAGDYLNDLNAMREAEKTLTHDQWRIYLGFVMGARTIPRLASMEEFHKAWNATASQRAEAFLRTIGKWEDE